MLTGIYGSLQSHLEFRALAPSTRPSVFAIKVSPCCSVSTLIKYISLMLM